MQINKASSAITIHYNMPEKSSSQNQDGVTPETINFSQVNDTKLDKAHVNGTGALLNLGNQYQPYRPSSSRLIDPDDFDLQDGHFDKSGQSRHDERRKEHDRRKYFGP